MSTVKEIVICEDCKGTGEKDVEQQFSGHTSDWIKIPCVTCGKTGRRIKITSIQFAPFKERNV